MPLSRKEIEPGIIAFLKPEILIANRRIEYLGTRPFRCGPFVCVQVMEDSSLWFHITRQPGVNAQRLNLRKEWRRDGEPHWHDDGSYVSNIRMPFVGPLDAFIAAGQIERPFVNYRRPSVSIEAIEAIIAAMIKRGVPLLE